MLYKAEFLFSGHWSSIGPYGPWKKACRAIRIWLDDFNVDSLRILDENSNVVWQTFNNAEMPPEESPDELCDDNSNPFAGETEGPRQGESLADFLERKALATSAD